MTNQEITVVYKWTAKPGKAEELKAVYREVEKQMQETETDALKVDCYFEESSNTLIVYILFKDGAALGQHLGTTAAGHFPTLLQIAIPGPFLFCGDVPEELKQAMGFKSDFNLNGVEGLTRRDRIKLMGNGVCPPVMEAIVKSLTVQSAM